MTFRKTTLIIGIVALFISVLPLTAPAMAPVDAVRFQVEHEFSAGRMGPDMRDDLMGLLAEAKSASQDGNDAAYRVHVDAFREKLRSSPSNEIQEEAAERILSVARSLQ